MQTPDGARDSREFPLLTESTRRRWHDPERPERPEERNGVTLSMLQLLNSMIGSGILSFPYVFAQTGWVLGCCLVALFGSMNMVSNRMLIETGVAVGMPTGDTSEIIEAALKSPRWRRVVDICVALQSFGSLLSYNNVMGDLGAVVLIRHTPGVYPTVIAVCTVLLSPACFPRAYGDIAWVAVTSFSLIACTTTVVTIKGIISAKGIPVGPQSVLGIFASLGNYAFAMSNQFAVHETYASMRPADRPAIPRVFDLSAGIASALLVSMGLGGLALLGASSNRLASSVIEALNPNLVVTKFLACITILHLMAYIPNDFIIMRLYGCRFFDVNPLTIPRSRYVALTLVLLATPAVMMALIPRADIVGVFELIITLTGAIPVALGVFFVPIYAFKRACLDEKLGEDKSMFPALRRNPWLAYLFLALSLLILILAPIFAITLYVLDCLNKSCAEYGHRR